MTRTTSIMDAVLGGLVTRLASDCPRVRFQGREYIMVGDAITTRQAYENFEDSFAHLFYDGLIRRYGVIIGKREDITYIGSEAT